VQDFNLRNVIHLVELIYRHVYGYYKTFVESQLITQVEDIVSLKTIFHLRELKDGDVVANINCRPNLDITIVNYRMSGIIVAIIKDYRLYFVLFLQINT
jgi:hypothetical protein